MKFPYSRRRVAPVENDVIQLQGSLSHLPVELLLVIFQHFVNLGDILSTLNVCRAWRHILLSPDIWPSLADRCAPGLAAHIRASCSERQPEAFHLALRQAHLRNSGYFTHVTHHALRLNLGADSFFTLSRQLPVAGGGVHSLDSVIDLDPAAEQEHMSRLKLYSHGRVAWWPESWHLPFFAIVDDLHTRIRRMYLFPRQHGEGDDRQRGWKTAMGEFLFVMGQEDAGVCVWHLERGEMKAIKLPGAFDRCVVQGERLLFVGRRGAQVWMWTWNTSLVETIDVSAQGCYPPGPVTMGGQIVLGYPPNPNPAPRMGLRFRDTDMKLDFILHPTDPDVLFVVTYDEVELVVHEFTSGQLTTRISLPHDHLAYRVLQRSRSPNTVHYLRHERCDARGGYCLVTAWLGLEPICNPCNYPGGIGSVCFNVYTKRFTAFVHHADYQRTPDTHLWDGLLAVGVASRRDSGDGPSSEPTVVLLKPCDGDGVDGGASLRPGDPLPMRTGQPAAMAAPVVARFVSASQDMRARPQQLDRVAYALLARHWRGYELGGPDESAIRFNIPENEWLNGDDKTLIYVTGKEYTIWTFGEDGVPKRGKDEEKGGRAWRHRWRSIVATRRPQ